MEAFFDDAETKNHLTGEEGDPQRQIYAIQIQATFHSANGTASLLCGPEALGPQLSPGCAGLSRQAEGFGFPTELPSHAECCS